MSKELTTDPNFDWLKLIDIIIWPSVLLVIAILFIKPVKQLLSRITRIGYGDKSIETAPINGQSQEKPAKGDSTVDQSLGIFRPSTVELFKLQVEKETEVESLSEPTEKIERLMNYSIVLYIKMNFEFLYNNIYGSQIRILEQLNAQSFETKTSLKSFYNVAIEQYPDSYTNYSYNNYLGFLVGQGLISVDDDQVKITTLAIDFLKYMTETKKNVNKTL